MSKWTAYQLLVTIVFGVLIVVNNIYAENLSLVFSFINQWISPSILIIFFTVILIIWGVAIILLMQEKKGKTLFVHKIWKIMPAIVGVLLFLSIVILLVLGMTVFSNASQEMHWIFDLLIVYFLSLYYFFVLSIFIRYSTIPTNNSKILASANSAVLILLFVILFLPML